MGLEYVPDCVMKVIVNRNRKIRQLQRWGESHKYNEQKENELERLIKLGHDEYYDRMNHVPKRERIAKIQCNRFIHDFSDMMPRPPKSPEQESFIG